MVSTSAIIRNILSVVRQHHHVQLKEITHCASWLCPMTTTSRFPFHYVNALQTTVTIICLENAPVREKKFKFTIKENFTIDVDECAEKRHNCDLITSVCKNVPGSYECHCLPGLEGTGDICIGKISKWVHKTEKLILKLLDIDECQRGIAKCHGNLLNV